MRSRKNCRFSGKKREYRVRLTCWLSASTCAKSVFSVRSRVTLLDSPYFTSAPISRWVPATRSYPVASSSSSYRCERPPSTYGVTYSGRRRSNPSKAIRAAFDGFTKLQKPQSGGTSGYI